MTRRENILIVEDNEDVRILLQELLEDAEYSHIALATTGLEAIAQVKRHTPDLILMDMSLPEMSGWEAVAQIRRIPGFAHTPILALTAHVSKADRDRSMAIGCNAHIGKPFDIFTLLTTVEDLLELTE